MQGGIKTSDVILPKNDLIIQEKIAKHIQHTLPLYVFDQIDSTNRFAKTVCDDYALIVADKQSAGRGRLGRAFFSPSGAGVYMSLKAKIDDLYKNVPFITTLASVAVHKAIKALYNIDCGIKWVNDIYIGTKKVAGILCEVCDDTHAIIGIGINVYPSSLPDELKSIATHLTQSPTAVTRNRLIAMVADNLLQLISSLPDTSFMAYYKENSIVIGKNVLCTSPGFSFEAKAIDIDNHGGLVVETFDGTKTLSSGEITIRFTD